MRSENFLNLLYILYYIIIYSYTDRATRRLTSIETNTFDETNNI